MIQPIETTEEIYKYFEPEEGFNTVYYGKIGHGKTRNATADIIELLKRGEIVFANWKINFEGFNEMEDKKVVFAKFLGGKKKWFKFDKSNFYYIDPQNLIENKEGSNIHLLARLVGAHLFIDEGQWIFDSYEGTKFSKEKRRLILHTRHLNRSLNIISQRTQAIQVSARGQVNRFYKIEKKMQWPFLIFKRTEYQDMADNDVDESDDSKVSTKVYFARKEILEAYDSKYLRAGVKRSQEIYFNGYLMNFNERTKALLRAFSAVFRRRESDENTNLNDSISN